jgi:allantoin racemase
MKILLINPNISTSVTDLIKAEALRVASPGVEIGAMTSPFGVAYIETRAEATVGAYAVLEMIARHHHGYDAVIVAAYGDPGVLAAKEMMDKPVIGLTEATLAQAHLMGGRFSLVGISQRIGVWYRETVASYGFSDRFISYRGLEQQFSDVGLVQQERGEMLHQMCMTCVQEDQADSIILCGAPLAGLARAIEQRVPVPLIDGVGSAVRMAEALVRGPRFARSAGSYAPSPKKMSVGLSSALSAYLGMQQPS